MTTPDRPLDGKVAVITGASRGIGRAIALELAGAGAKIIGNSVDVSKKRRVDEVMAEIRKKGSEVDWVYADISTEDGRGNLFEEALYSHPVNFLFLNAAGGLETDKPDGWPELINIESQLELVEGFKGQMDPGGAIIYETSLWAEGFGKVKQLPFYRPVARTKYLAERRLRELIPDLQQEGIRMGFLCGHIITDTSAHTLMSRAFPEQIKNLEATAERGKFPSAREMGQAALSILLSDDFVPGYTRYVGGRNVEPIEAKMIEAYSLNKDEIRVKLPMYGDSKLLVDEFHSPEEDDLGHAKETGIAEYTVREGDTDGHFSGDFEDIKLFRGVDQIEAAAQATGLVFLGLEPDLQFVPFFKGVGRTQFLKMAFPGDQLRIHTSITSMNPQGVRGNAELKVGDEVISTVEQIELGFAPSIEYARRLIARQKASRKAAV